MSLLRQFSALAALFVVGSCLFAAEDEYGYGDRGYDKPTETVENADRPTALRRPGALVLSPDESRLYVMLRDTSAIAIVDLSNGAVVGESPVGSPDAPGKLAAMIAGPTRTDGRLTLFVADETNHKVWALAAATDRVEAIAAVETPPYPVGLAWDADESRLYVSSLWTRQASRAKWSGESLVVEKTVDLPLAPRSIAVLPAEVSPDKKTRVAIADSFGGRLAIVEAELFQLERVREFPGHNVRALAVTPERDRIVMGHQMLNEYAHSINSDIQWGIVIQNDLRWLPVKNLLDDAATLYAGGHVHPLGSPGHGGADPSGLVLGGDKRVAVALGGFNKVMVGREGDFSLRPIRVGRRPTAVTMLADGSRSWVANTFDDSLTEIDMEAWKPLREVRLGPSAEKTLEQKGEEVFYTGRYSHQGWMSCHSCHPDGHTNMTRNDNLSDGGFGAPKQVLSLLGRRDTAPFAWNGAVADLRSQMENSIRKTMQTDREPTDDDVKALTAYVASLPSPPSFERLRETADESRIARGKELFASRKCATCHAGRSYTSPETFDVGLRDELGETKFNPPALLGVGQRDAYLHDGRAKTLEAVFLEHAHPERQEWTPEQIADLTAFLRSL